MQKYLTIQGRTVVDLTHTETIYRRSLRTIFIKVAKPECAAEDEFMLQTVGKPEDVYEILRSVFATLDDDQEHFVLLVLNVQNDVMGFKVISSGAQDHTVVDPKVVYRNALLLGAKNIIVAHNHPSGKLVASTHDRSLTEKLVSAGRVLDIDLLDHIICGHTGFLSMRDDDPDLFWGMNRASEGD